MIVGIDFGTCYSSVAIMSGLIPVTTCVKDTTGVGVPSLFMYSAESGKELYGEQCKTGEAYRHSGDIVRYMKRLVRQNSDNLESRITSGGKDFLLKEVIEKYLAFLVSEAKKGATEFGEFTSTDIEEITITAPVGIAQGQMMATDYNRLLMEVVQKITGLGESRIHILQEPVAAAISYLYSQDMKKHYDQPQTILVYDLGGGTLDVTIMRHDPRAMTYDILGKEGDLLLGGNDWDNELAEAVKRKAGVSGFESDEESARFIDAVTKLKVDLTDGENSMIFFTENGEDRFCKFSREEFENLTKGLLERSISVVNKAIGDFDAGLDGIDKIVLVGGSCNMPQIKERLEEEYPDKKDDTLVFEPSKAIAKGAAVYAKMVSNAGGSQPGKVHDITTVSYGFQSNYQGRYPRIFNMIFKDTRFGDDGAIRARSDSYFVPHEDSQTAVVFSVYESGYQKAEGSGEEGNWCDLGNGEIQNGLEVSVQVPPQYLGKAQAFCMWPEFILNSNGILEITIYDRAGNKLAFATNRKQ